MSRNRKRHILILQTGERLSWPESGETLLQANKGVRATRPPADPELCHPTLNPATQRLQARCGPTWCEHRPHSSPKMMAHIQCFMRPETPGMPLRTRATLPTHTLIALSRHPPDTVQLVRVCVLMQVIWVLVLVRVATVLVRVAMGCKARGGVTSTWCGVPHPPHQGGATVASGASGRSR
jgi:hypothetical protein